jgi:GT2 family glycosyltransferase
VGGNDLRAPVDASIIIVNWKSADFLRQCVASVFEQTPGIRFEVIVVDNASFDGSKGMLEREFPLARYIQSEENLGFARANNLGAQHATGEILLFLNPDTIILDHAILKMVKRFQSVPEAGILGCSILNADRTLQTSAIQSFPSILNQVLDAEILRNRFPQSPLWGIAALYQSGNSAARVEMISGAFLSIRASLFQQVHGFSEEYFMYGEDADLCRKVHDAGGQIEYLPTAQIIHFGGQSSKQQQTSAFSSLMMQESLNIYFRKFHGKGYSSLFRLSKAITSIGRLLLLYVLRPFSASEGGPQKQRSSIEKWKAVLRWSLGLHRAETPNSVVRANNEKPTFENIS